MTEIWQTEVTALIAPCFCTLWYFYLHIDEVEGQMPLITTCSLCPTSHHQILRSGPLNAIMQMILKYRNKFKTVASKPAY